MSFKQKLEFKYIETKQEAHLRLRKDFAKQLTYCVTRAYSGKIPSYAKIAQDYSLHAKSDGAVSAESIRKWMQGIAIPHPGRLQTLFQWLGFELAEVLHLLPEQSKIKNINKEHPKKGDPATSVTSKNDGQTNYQEIRLIFLIKSLSKDDKTIALSMLEALKKAREINN